MIASSPSPTINPTHSSTPRNVWSRPNYPSSGLSTVAAAAGAATSPSSTTAGKRGSSSASPSSSDMKPSHVRSSPRGLAASAMPTNTTSAMRDASTQYSPPETPVSDRSSIRGKRKAEPVNDTTTEIPKEEDDCPKPRLTPQTRAANAGKPHSDTTTIPTSSSAASTLPNPPTTASTVAPEVPQTETTKETDAGPSKRARPLDPATKIVPIQYEDCPSSDLVPIIASMLMELIRHNDDMPVTNTGLTRFHSRAPPGISVQDYLQRLAHHATLSPPILLCMVYYIDRLCAIWPKFTINSLTVHRYLIASATVASKGLSDSFWTNATYARVGGVSLKELALLELEFLWRIEWRIVPKPEVLVDYYKSLVQRCPGYEIDKPSGNGVSPPLENGHDDEDEDGGADDMIVDGS